MLHEWPIPSSLVHFLQTALSDLLNVPRLSALLVPCH